MRGFLLALCLPGLAVAASFPDWVARYEPAIVQYESQPTPAPGEVVVIGNGNIARWSSIRVDLAPLTIIPRGFGGSTAIEALYYLPRIVTRYQPQSVIICEGENDFAAGYSPKDIANRHADMLLQIRASQPDARVVFIALKPSPLQWNKWPEFQQTNARLKSVCATFGRCLFVDPSPALLGDDGKPRAELYAQDGAHLNSDGYAAWTKQIAAPIVKFLGREAKVPKAPTNLRIEAS